MATRGLRSRGSVGQPRSCRPCQKLQGTSDSFYTDHLCSNVLPPPPALAFRRQPVLPVDLAASRQGSWFGLSTSPIARSSVRLAAPLRSMTGSITRTIQSVRLGTPKGKRPKGNPEVVPTKVADLPRWGRVVPNARGCFPQAIPNSAGPRRARAAHAPRARRELRFRHALVRRAAAARARQPPGEVPEEPEVPEVPEEPEEPDDNAGP